MEQPLSAPSPFRRLSLIIADDHQLFSDGLKTMLGAENDLSILSQVFNGNEIAHAVQKYAPDLLLLDLNMPGKDGLALAAEFKRDFPKLKIILLTMYSDKQFIAKAKAIGVDGYLLKTASKGELLSAIRDVRLGGYCYPDTETDKRHENDPFMQKYKLTAREQEIISFIKEGMSNQEIADRIFLSVFTVETHRRNINLKLGVNKPAELILKAIEIGL